MNSLYAYEEEIHLSTYNRLWPQGGLFYQSHFGPTVILGVAYSTLDYQQDAALYGPYMEASVGMYGYGSDIGWVWGVGGVVWGTSISYANVNDDKSDFSEGNYYGFALKVSGFLLSLRMGVYYEPKLDENKANFSIGLGF